MGQRGPKPLPGNVHLLRGNASKKPLGALLDEFQPEVEIPSFPSWIWPEAKKEWKRISGELERYGLVSKLDRAALVLYCQAWAKMVWSENQLSRAMKQAETARLEAEAKGEEYTGGDGLMIKTVTSISSVSRPVPGPASAPVTTARASFSKKARKTSGRSFDQCADILRRDRHGLCP